MLNLFRSKPPSISGHEARLADLDQQIADAEIDLKHADTTATEAALDGANLAAAVEGVVRATAELAALKKARELVASELADLRAKAAEAALQAKCDSAKKRVETWKRRAEDLRDKIAPLLKEVDAVIDDVNRIYGFINGPIPREMRNQMSVAIGATSHTIDNCEAALSFLAKLDEGCADRVAAIP